MDVREIPGRGLGVVATRPLQSGEVILTELPILLYPQASAVSEVCSFCLRWLSAPGVTPVACSSCSSAGFCSPQCATAAAADPASHNPFVCRALACCNIAGLSDEDQSALHYLSRASSLLLAAHSGSDPSAATRYAQLTALAGAPPASTPPSSSDALRTQELYGRLRHALSVGGLDPSPITIEVITLLLERDAVNGYGIGAPLLPGSESEEDRRLRGSGLYASASRVNHECLPNAARFDAFDAPIESPTAAPGSNTALHLRMLHALPAGEEVTQSYFPLTWTFYQRQERCRDQYGFLCSCPRCREEATWPQEERGDDETVGARGIEFAEGVKNVPVKANADVADAGYIHVFLFKYVCPREGCGGTLAPLPGQSDVMQCNVCDKRRTEAEFLAELEASS